MKKVTKFSYITDDGTEFETEQEALDYENSEPTDFTLKHDYKPGDIVFALHYVKCNPEVLKCEIVSEDFTFHTDYEEEDTEIVYPKAKTSCLNLKSLDSTVIEFTLYYQHHLNAISKNLFDLLTRYIGSDTLKQEINKYITK